ncbi:unnamed protein product [Medioppia subpectinata]|uniref:Terpene synthase n=1 Tax=Medioppia subpectinata TaxID=1979941 RepID=A0A7R9L5L3_9ACAR|nr:unnamed protein product [Medioppia subpectinata]CAG2115948.1 unnamed protein product [Medioppia subpectinata]
MSDNKHQESAQRKYQVPNEMATIFTVKRNALHNIEPMAGAAHQWLRECSLFTDRQYKRMKNTSNVCAYFWPFFAAPDRYDTLLKFVIHLYIVDDHTECRYGDMYRRQSDVGTIYGQLYAACDKVLAIGGQHVPAHHWKPYVLGAYAIYDTVCAAYNDIQKRRFIKYIRGYYEGSVAECQHIDRKRQFDNLDEFYEVRIKSAGVEAALQLIEYADGLYVPENEWRNPIFQRLFEMLCRLVVICNDMYSFEKEVLDAGSADRVYGCVTALAQIENISLTESMNRWVTNYNLLEKSTMVVADELLEADWTSPDTRVFIQHGLALIGGNWKVHSFLDRYNTMFNLEEFE